VFVPGFTAPAEIWEPQLRHFAATHRVIALDPRSQGRSEKATEGHYLARRGRDIGVNTEPGQLHPFAPLWTTWIEEIQLNRRTWTREWVQGMFSSEQPTAYIDTMTEAVLATPTNTAVTLLTNLMFMGPTDLRPALDTLDRPVLYVVARQDWGEEVRARRADVRVEVFENTGHALFADEADRFNQLLEEFLATL
jgi:non-heme chloroperoxidase